MLSLPSFEFKKNLPLVRTAMWGHEPGGDCNIGEEAPSRRARYLCVVTCSELGLVYAAAAARSTSLPVLARTMQSASHFSKNKNLRPVQLQRKIFPWVWSLHYAFPTVYPPAFQRYT